MRNQDANVRRRPGVGFIERSLNGATQGNIQRITLRKRMGSGKGENKSQYKRQQYLYLRIHESSYSSLSQLSFCLLLVRMRNRNFDRFHIHTLLFARRSAFRPKTAVAFG